ncbi:MAG: 2-C-methyl-D-erythritol 4-phosphate cytidylyltransferase [Chlamydiales bacterium]|nr:2-C-methyl-D-erythritol 4-phosphate cytidylyltransferase [Chlamydiales bacterium]
MTLNQTKYVSAILLMGGKGARFKSALPKQFHALAGKKIYLHTLERFLKSSLFAEIILVCPEEWAEEVKSDLEGCTDNIRIAVGGATRQESSYLGLLACSPQTTHVVIHDAVRPFVTEKILRENIAACQAFEAADTCTPSADTIVHSKDGQKIDEIPQRAHYLRGQTPQSFSYPLILKAHELAEKEGRAATDDCSLVLALGHPVRIVEGDESNIKITTDLDLYLAEQLFRRTSPPSEAGSAQRSLNGKLFAITGGTGDIGRAIGAALEKEGARVQLISRSSEPYMADLSSPSQCEALFKQLASIEGPLDGLINCIGLFKLKEVDALDSSEIEELISTNLTSVILSCKHAEIKEGGDIINIASSAYSRGRKGYAVYSAAKAAVVNFTQALAEERPWLRINALAPQRTQSRMRSSYFPEEEPSSLLTPTQVADAVLALLKEESSTTGITLEVRRADPLVNSR